MRTVLRLLVLATLTANFAIAAEKSPLGESLKDIDVADHWIYDDWPRAVEQAKATGKPLMVVLRCIPLPAGQDARCGGDAARQEPGGAGEEVRLRADHSGQSARPRSVPVRLRHVVGGHVSERRPDDLRPLRQPRRDGKESDRLLSTAGFRKAAERCSPCTPTIRKTSRPSRRRRARKRSTLQAAQIPGLTDRPAVATERKNCVHCHMLKEFALRAKWEAGKLSTTDLFVYPLPQTIGITTDIDDGLKVTAVAAGSPAAAAGIAAGDSLVSINGQPLISLADIQWALHTAPTSGTLAVKLQRGGQTLEKTIALSGDWKRSDIAWRASSWLGLRKGLKTEPLSSEEKTAKGIAADRLALSVKGIYGQGEHPAKNGGPQAERRDRRRRWPVGRTERVGVSRQPAPQARPAR